MLRLNLCYFFALILSRILYEVNPLKICDEGKLERNKFKYGYYLV